MGVLSSTPRTWVASEIVTAAELNTEVRDPITAMEAAWGTWTPTIANITLGTGSTTVARYNQVGKTIDFKIAVTLGTGGALTGSPTFTPPVTALGTGEVFAGSAYDTSATSFYPFAGILSSTTLIVTRTWPSTAGNALIGNGAAVPFTWAVGDILTISGRYEAA